MKKTRNPREKKEIVPVKNEFPVPKDVLNEIALKGDLRGLNDDQLTRYYFYTCHQFNLNPATKPFDIITFRDGKKVMYANKNCAEQLRINHGISVVSIEQRMEDSGEIYIVSVSVKNKTGRIDGDIGAVNIKGLHGDVLANKIMTATTKAKRRATYSICGLGMMDETEVDTIPGVVINESVFKEMKNEKEIIPENEISEKENENLLNECLKKFNIASTLQALGETAKQYIHVEFTQEQRQKLNDVYKIRKSELLEAQNGK